MPVQLFSIEESDTTSSFINMGFKSWSIRCGGESPRGSSHQEVSQSILSFKLHTNLIIFQQREEGFGSRFDEWEIGLGFGGEWWEGDDGGRLGRFWY